jgi:hypothetical protein
VPIEAIVSTIAIAVAVMAAGLLIVYFIGMKVYKKIEESIVRIDKKSDMKGSAVMAGIPMEGNPMNDNYMVSYSADQWGVGVPTTHAVLGGSVSVGEDSNAPSEEKKPVKQVAVRPIDVVEELINPPTNWSLNEIDAKMDILKAKKELLKGGTTTGRDLDSLLLCMENRKKYLDQYEYAPDKSMAFKSFFEQWDVTNEAAIKRLTDKYSGLQFHSADIFVPELPDEAAKIMISYNDAVVAICDKKPRFYVIAKAEDFQKKYEKRDPILLVQSPFGIYYNILGAWDEEMIYLPEL